MVPKARKAPFSQAAAHIQNRLPNSAQITSTDIKFQSYLSLTVTLSLLTGGSSAGCHEIRFHNSKEREWRRNVNHKLGLEVLTLLLPRAGKERLNQPSRKVRP